MKAKEIRAEDLNAEKWIQEKVRELRKKVGDGLAINALSGGVDSSVVTALGHMALGDRLRTCFIWRTATGRGPLPRDRRHRRDHSGPEGLLCGPQGDNRSGGETGGDHPDLL
jgi:NH3-dependent NAD+ synthetase